ncbi:enoyl-CoA hydratase/isomerase family protein [bacterium]|nr:enoyl-CoA hydratase/isomerase family protein [bacterium]
MARYDTFQDMNAELYFETRENITRVYFNRPEKLNAFNLETSERFAALIKRLHKEKSRVVIFTGRGKAFCAGADLAFLESCARLPQAKARAILKKLYSNYLTLRTLKQVTIAQVNGAVAGGGLGMVLASDLRTLLASAKVAFNFVKIGLSPGMGILKMSEGLFGPARAKELWLLGRTYTGADLAQWGAASACEATPEALERATNSLAQELLENAPLGMEFIKKEQLWKDALSPYLAFNCTHQARCLTSAQGREGLRAIQERRKPRFE